MKMPFFGHYSYIFDTAKRKQAVFLLEIFKTNQTNDTKDVLP